MKLSKNDMIREDSMVTLMKFLPRCQALRFEFYPKYGTLSTAKGHGGLWPFAMWWRPDEADSGK